jgi:two-component system sensor histidine kinase PilS (NtrC family)
VTEGRALARRLRWLVAIRLVVVTSVVLPIFLLRLAPAPEMPPGSMGPPEPTAAVTSAVEDSLLASIAGFTYLASLLYLILLKVLRGHHVGQAYFQFVGDLLLVTVMVYLFGGIESPFSILYLLVIAVATTLLKRRSTVVATLAFVLYAGLLVSLSEGWIPLADGSMVVSDEATYRRLAYNLSIHLFAFYAVTFLTWLLVENVAETERELEEKREHLADLEIQYRDVIQSITSGVITTDREGRVTTINRAGLAILRRDEGELLGRPIEETGLFTQERWLEVTEGREDRGRLSSEITVYQGAAPISVGYSLSDLRDAEEVETGTIVIFQDLTPWRQLEEEVRRNDRMAAVGTLAAGLAHEIGNPLAAISGSVQMLRRKVEGEGPEDKLLAIVSRESQRLDRTIKGFLEYARPRRPEASPFDVARLLADQFELLANSPEVLPSHRLELDLESESAWLVADPDGVSQIFWNLTKNALKAMPDGGTLKVSTRDRDGVYALDVLDTGRGMTEEERADLFHPFRSFFDTGSGLGMAIVYRVVEDHGGRLSVDSAPGSHTRITVELPREGVDAGKERARA